MNYFGTEYERKKFQNNNNNQVVSLEWLLLQNLRTQNKRRETTTCYDLGGFFSVLTDVFFYIVVL